MVNMRNDILADCVKEFPCIYDRKDEGYKDCAVLGNAWQKNVEKLKNSDSNMEVEAKAAFANLKKRCLKRRITQKSQKFWTRSKEVEKLINGFKDHEFFSVD